MTIIAEYFNKYKVYLPYLIVFLIGLGAGFYLAPTKEVIKDGETQIQTVYTEQIKYVEKESPQDADVKITNQTPVVEVDGQKFVFTPIEGEKYKFDKGYLDIRQGYEVSIKREKTVYPNLIDLGVTNHGTKLGVGHNFNENFSAYVEGTVIKSEGKDRYYGVGIKGTF